MSKYKFLLNNVLWMTCCSIVYLGCVDDDTQVASYDGFIEVYQIQDLSITPDVLLNHDGSMVDDDMGQSQDLQSQDLQSRDLQVAEFDSFHQLDMERNFLDRDLSPERDASTLLDVEISEPDQTPLHELDNWQTLQLTDVLLKASHNSYEGGVRGSIISQLNQGIRGLEFDIHDNDFQTYKYRIGHFSAGDGVDHSGENPTSNQLEDWLHLIDLWSQTHFTHAPIILTIDLKDNLTDNRSFAEGNLAHLNEIFEKNLNTLHLASLPFNSLEELRGKVLCVLSGDQQTRLGYLYDTGRNPHISLFGDQILEVHDSGSGHLWYWSGKIKHSVDEESKIIWHRHGRYDTGQKPAVLLVDQTVIEVHQSGITNQLWYHIGSLSVDGELALSNAVRFESAGRDPTIQLINAHNPIEIAVRYRSIFGQLLERHGVVNLQQQVIDWSEPAQTAEPPFDNTTSSFGNHRILVGSHSELELEIQPTPSQNALSYKLIELNREVDQGLIRYHQHCFVEWQNNESTHQVLGAQRFGAVSNTNQSSLSDSTLTTRSMVRIWSFNHSTSTITTAHLPASDQPLSDAYQAYCEQDPRWIE